MISEVEQAHNVNLKDIESLTNREIEVLALMSVGHTNKSIAGQLYLAVATVEKHLKSIFEKLSAKNRTVAARMIWEYKLKHDDK